MDVPAMHRTAPVQVIRDRGGVVIGRLEEQHLTGRTLARDARGVLIGIYEHRSNTTRNAHGVVIAHGDVLAALLFRR